MKKHFGFTEGNLCCAVMLAVSEGFGDTTSDISRAIDEPINLVSGTLKYLINKKKLKRTKNNESVFCYSIPMTVGGTY